MKDYVHTKTHTWMFTRILFVVAPILETTQIAINRGNKQMVAVYPYILLVVAVVVSSIVIHSVTHYSTTKNSELLIDVTTWKNLIILKPSGINQTKMNTYCKLHF